MSNLTEVSNAHIQISEGWIETGPEDFSGAFQDCEIGEFGAGDLVLAEAKRAQFVERLKEWRANNDRIVIYFQTEGEIERFREIMEGTVEGVDFVEGSLARGFCFPAAESGRSLGCGVVRTIRSPSSKAFAAAACRTSPRPNRFQRTR